MKLRCDGASDGAFECRRPFVSRVLAHALSLGICILLSVVLGMGCASSRLSREETVLRELSPLVEEVDAQARADSQGPPRKHEGYSCPVCQF
jgi:hypothetical protein